MAERRHAPVRMSVPCGACGAPAWSRYGVCQRTKECRIEYVRRQRQALLADLAELQGWKCPECKRPLEADLSATQVDHIIPRSRGGPRNAAWNKQLIHGSCNWSKMDRITPLAAALAKEHGITIGPITSRRLSDVPMHLICRVFD